MRLAFFSWRARAAAIALVCFAGQAQATGYNARAAFLRTGTFVNGSSQGTVELPSNGDSPSIAFVGINVPSLSALGAGNAGKRWVTASAGATAYDPGGQASFSEGLTISGSANFFDRISFTPNDPARNGKPGMLEGLIGVTISKDGNVSLQDTVFVGGNSIHDGFSSGVFAFDVPIVFGQPLDIFFSASATLDAVNSANFSDPPREPRTVFAYRGYNAISWRGITRVTDADGNAADLSFGGGGGTPTGAFPVDVSSVLGLNYILASDDPEVILPEPATLGLFLLPVLVRRRGLAPRKLGALKTGQLGQF